jgi:hypothetical protein
MSDSNNLLSIPVDKLVADIGSISPVVAQAPREKDARETSSGCRERADADLLRAGAMETVNGREVFEKSAASWTKRADMLQRIETGIEARLTTPATTATALTAPELTSAEIAEDAAYLQV